VDADRGSPAAPTPIAPSTVLPLRIYKMTMRGAAAGGRKDARSCCRCYRESIDLVNQED